MTGKGGEKFLMKKDILAIFALILLISVLVMGTNIQSVDEYYMTHLDDITETGCRERMRLF